ncbi:MAG: hypothetical protein ACYSU3_17895, partial [Planctomycetota bacterium]
IRHSDKIVSQTKGISTRTTLKKPQKACGRSIPTHQKIVNNTIDTITDSQTLNARTTIRRTMMGLLTIDRNFPYTPQS